MDRTILIEDARFRVEAEFLGPTILLAFIGIINEDVNFDTILSRLSTYMQDLKTVKLDALEIQSINSPGVRGWLLFLENLRAKVEIRFQAVNEMMISQANMIPSLLGPRGTPVLTCEVPYRCGKCRTQLLKTFKTAEISFDGAKFHAPLLVCAQCNSPLELDGIEEEFFEFLRHAQNV